MVRDQLVQPYLAGLTFARALWARGGGEALREAWGRPPQSTEQVLHPEKFFSREKPRVVAPAIDTPRGGRLLSEGVLGEMLLRTLVEDAGEAAADGWGGDGWRLWDVGGRTALAWRSEWDSVRDAEEFHAALRARFARYGEPASRAGWEVFDRGGGRRYAMRRVGRRGRLRLRRRRGALRPDGRGVGGGGEPACLGAFPNGTERNQRNGRNNGTGRNGTERYPSGAGRGTARGMAGLEARRREG